MSNEQLLILSYSLLIAVVAVLAWFPAAWSGFVTAAFLAGGLLVGLYRRDVLSARQVLVGAVLFRLLFLPLPPGLSDDGFRYVWDGLVQVQGVNPYRYLPEADALAPLHDEPIYEELNSASYYSVYPPAPQLAFWAGGLFYDGGWRVSFYVIKALFVLLELGGVFVLARMVPARRLLLYAWNPLVLVEIAGQGHTEAALVFFLVMTLWCARTERGGWASVFLAGAVWAKLYPLVLFPFLWRRFGWRAVWPGALASVLLWLPYAAQYVPAHLLDSLDLYVRLFEFNAGPYYAVKELFYLFTGVDWSKWLGPAFGVLFAGALPALYVLDARRGWTLRRAFLVTLGFFLALSTTVHPWYLLAVLPLAVFGARPSWHWHWLALFSLGTYLFYVGGPYWVFVIVGWGGWAALGLLGRQTADGGPRLSVAVDRLLRNVLLAVRCLRPAVFMPLLQSKRSKMKARRIVPLFPRSERSLRVLDLGAGEGYVGEHLRKKTGAEVVLADVIDLNRTDLSHVVYDGRTLPFADDAFDVTVLYFVLHHCAAPEQVLREALRVSRRRVIVVESLHRTRVQHRLLRFLDRAANRLRSGGRMRVQEEYLHFRTADEWRTTFRSLGAEVVEEYWRGRWVHPQAFFVLTPP